MRTILVVVVDELLTPHFDAFNISAAPGTQECQNGDGEIVLYHSLYLPYALIIATAQQCD